MRSIGETIEFCANSSLEAGVEQSSAGGSDGATSFLMDDDAGNIFALTGVVGTRGNKRFDPEHLQGGYPDHGVDAGPCRRSSGYQDAGERRVTIERIRRHGILRRLPIIGAKVMKGDREKCLEVSASDYLAKPVNTERPLSICLEDVAASLIGGENARQ
jgi:hypothetical protein